MASLFFTSLFISVDCRADSNGWEEVFFRSNQAYKEARYKDAAKGYGQLIRSGHESGHLYYNLGNAWFRLGRIGKAILNYERALSLIPRNADLNFNLRHARDRIMDDIPQSKGLFQATFFWLDSLSLKELFHVFFIINILFWGVLIVRQFTRSEPAYYLFLALLVLWVLAVASFGLKWYQTETDDRAVILAKEVNILAGPDTKDIVLFKLHDGTIVRHERSEDGWALIRLPDKKRGWLRETIIKRINGHR